MNVLFLSQAKQIVDQRSYHESMLHAQTKGLIGNYVNIPVYGYAKEHGAEGLWREIVRVCENDEMDLVFFQFFHGPRIQSPKRCVETLRSLRRNPTIAVSCGDPFSNRWRCPPGTFVELSTLANVTFLTSMGDLSGYLAQQGARNLMFMPHAFSRTVFTLPQGPMVSDNPEFDVVMVASSGWTLNPRGWYMNWASWKREKMVERLYRRYGKRFAVFGYGWKNHPAWQGPIAYNNQDEAFRRGRLVVDGRPPFSNTYYASDRPFYVAGSGIPLIQHYTPRFENIFRTNHHAHYLYRDEDVVSVCDRVLGEDGVATRQQLADTLQLISERHTCDHRIEHILDVCGRIRDASGTGSCSGLRNSIPLPYFLPEVDWDAERAFALVNWD